MRQPLWDFSLVGESRLCGAECVIPGVRSCSFYFWSCPEHKTTKHTTTTKHQNLHGLSMLLEHGQVFCVVAGTEVKTCWFPLTANCCPQLQAPSAEAGLAARDPHMGSTHGIHTWDAGAGTVCVHTAAPCFPSASGCGCRTGMRNEKGAGAPGPALPRGPHAPALPHKPGLPQPGRRVRVGGLGPDLTVCRALAAACLRRSPLLHI